MPKKRRDKERDPSTRQRITGYVKAAAATIAGAAFFNRYATKDATAFTSTAKNIGSDLLGKKKTASNILDSFDRHVGYKGSVYKQTRSLKRTYSQAGSEKIRLTKVKGNVANKGIVGRLKDYFETKNNVGIIKDKHHYNVKEKLKFDIKSALKNYTNIDENKKAQQLINDIVQDAYHKVEKSDGIYKNKYGVLKTHEEFLRNKFDMLNESLGMDLKDDILNKVYETKLKADKTVNSKDFLKNAQNQAKILADEILNEKNLKGFHNTKENNKYSKASKFIKDVTGYDVDLEEVITGSRKATVGEVVEEYKKFRDGKETAFDFDSFKINVTDPNVKGVRNINFFEALNDLSLGNTDETSMHRGLLNKIKDLEFGHGIRVRELEDGTKHFYSTSEVDNMLDGAFHWFSETLPGNLMKSMDFYQTAKAPYVATFRAGSIDRIASLEANNVTNRLMNSYMYIGGNMMKITGEENNIRVSDASYLNDIQLISGEHGSLPRMVKDMLGTDRITANASDNKALQMLDLSQSGTPNVFERVKAALTKSKNPMWDKNRINAAKDYLENGLGENLSEEELIFRVDNLKTAVESFDEYTNLNNITDETLYKMLKGYTNEQGERVTLTEASQRKIRMLLKGDIGKDLYSKEAFEQANKTSANYEDYMKLLNSTEIVDGEVVEFAGDINNSHLRDLMSKYLRDSESVDNILNITTKTNKVMGLGIDVTRSSVMKADDVFRREIIKDVLLSEGVNSNGTRNINKAYDFINNLDINKNQKNSLTALNSWGIFDEDVLKVTNADGVLSEANIIVTNLETINKESPYTLSNIKNNLTQIIQDNYTSTSKPYFGNLSEHYTNDYNEYMSVKKSSLIDLLSDLNADHFNGVAKELVAGRKDIENLSLLTTIPYGMVARLNYAVEDLGIGLSMNSSGSSLDLIKNIGLKRILPVMAAVTAYDYLDYESENITGTSLTAAGARGIANLDMASRKIADATGMAYILDHFKESSVIAEYWTGSNEFQSYDERADWYENGYSPVRSSRFWSFGSSSEFRGGGIAYWQPNYLKRAESNWREIGIYGSADEKWKHSLIPTLRHPLSTINFLLDPYWLEKKNMDERPYPYTGKLFTEGTPWGAILNPTIGELIKPVKMLPEIRERLGNGGTDLKQILNNMNERIKQKSMEDDNIFVVSGTDIQNAEYTPYAYATPGETSFTISNGHSQGLQGVGWTSTVREMSDVRTDQLPNLVARGAIPSQIDDYASYTNAISYKDEGLGPITDLVNILRGMNTEIQNKSARIGTQIDNQNGALIYNNPVGNKIVSNDNFYTNKYTTPLLDNSKYNDYANDIGYSLKQLSGMYGFLGDMAFGEKSYEYKLEQAGNMYSFNRGFWDASMGGLGGQFMEIARRFFPHEDRSRVNYNPLVNNMNSWLPERFLKGDAYASLPKGEMRLPGKGYESIHELHPDQFASDGYGAFDRMKILADVAPTSEEYKLWKRIAKQTIRDEDLIEQMQEIEYRAKKAGMDHDFYEYRYINNPTQRTTDNVVEVLQDGTIKLASGMKVQMAGIKTTGEAVSTLVKAGDKVTVRTVKNDATNVEDEVVKALIYKDNNMPRSADNISKMLVEQGLAEKDKLDDSVLAPLATTGSVQESFGALQEIIGHAKIPFLHNKLLKIESAFESYKNEQIYGSSFQTWDNPIESFIKPQLNEQFRKGPLEELASIYGWKIFKDTMANGSTGKKIAASALLAASNPAATLGAGAGFLTKMKFGKEAMVGAHVGMAVGTIGWGIANADNPFTAVSSFALAGYEISRRLEVDDLIKNATKVISENPDTIKAKVSEAAVKLLGDSSELTHGKMAMIGAGVGLAISTLKNPDFNLNRLTGNWIPNETKERWDLEEYFDRLEYVKYMGLYHEAARRAKVLEGTDIGKIFAQLDKNKKDIIKLQRKAKKQGNKLVPGSSLQEAELAKLNAQIEALEMPDTALKGGKWTKSAIAYKKMAESTVYGLSEAATFDELLRAAPSQYKDYIQAFSAEKNAKKRKEILKYASPQMKKILQIAWGEKLDRQESNASYFKYKKLPGITWRGWKPNVNLKHVEMKTIENEGMILSDFGFYESEKAKASYEMAPDIENYDSSSSPFGLMSRANLMLALGGHGLAIENVSVETTSAPGLWIMGDVTQTASEVGQVAHRGVDKALSTLFL